MAIGRRKTAAPAPAPEPVSVIASAVRVTASNADWSMYRFTDEAWQTEGWRFYDFTPELHNTADYIGAACSLIRIYVEGLDENQKSLGEVVDDPQIASLADSLFGGPQSKKEILRGLGISLTVAGETYIIGRAARNGRGDKWAVAAPSQVRPLGDGKVTLNMGTGHWEELDPNRDIIIRVWTPHPARFTFADSPTRGVLVALRQMEQLVKFLASQLVSRIATASILPMPTEIDFPATDTHPGGYEGLKQQLYEVITTNLSGAGTAAMVAPILLPMPSEALAAMPEKPIQFESPLSQQAIDLRKELRETIAVGLNVPMDISLGGREMNHWSIWWANEEFIIKTVAPIMGRICEALTEAYLVPALEFLGKDPSRYTYNFDTAPLANSANRLQDAMNMYEKGLLSASAVRAAGAFNEVDAPDEEEAGVTFVKDVILRDPTLFQSEGVREYIRIEIDDFLPELTTPPPPPPVPERAIEAGPAGSNPGQPSAEELGLVSSVLPVPSAALAASDVLVLRALELAGKRMLTPALRKVWPNATLHELHTKVKVEQGQADRLLEGAWNQAPYALDGLNADVSGLTAALDIYARGLLTKSIKHDRSTLAAFLGERGQL